jgi:hypothetical protein
MGFGMFDIRNCPLRNSVRVRSRSVRMCCISISGKVMGEILSGNIESSETNGLDYGETSPWLSDRPLSRQSLAGTGVGVGRSFESLASRYLRRPAKGGSRISPGRRLAGSSFQHFPSEGRIERGRSRRQRRGRPLSSASRLSTRPSLSVPAGPQVYAARAAARPDAPPPPGAAPVAAPAAFIAANQFFPTLEGANGRAVELAAAAAA